MNNVIQARFGQTEWTLTTSNSHNETVEVFPYTAFEDDCGHACFDLQSIWQQLLNVITSLPVNKSADLTLSSDSPIVVWWDLETLGIAHHPTSSEQSPEMSNLVLSAHVSSDRVIRSHIESFVIARLTRGVHVVHAPRYAHLVSSFESEQVDLDALFASADSSISLGRDIKIRLGN